MNFMDFVDFEKVAQKLNDGCEGPHLNGASHTEWTRNCVQIGVNWCYSNETGKHLCNQCKTVFLQLYAQMVKNCYICQDCEKAVINELSKKEGYQNEKVIARLIEKLQCTTCSDR
jgi:hypothetical protein